MVNVIFLKELLLKKRMYSLREVPILKRDTIEVNHCLVQQSPFDARNIFSVLATPLKSQMSTSGVQD